MKQLETYWRWIACRGNPWHFALHGICGGNSVHYRWRLVGGMLPPIPNANDAPAELVAKVNENLLGFRVVQFSWLPLCPFRHSWRRYCSTNPTLETSPVFSYAQIVFAAGGTTVALLVAWGWSLMAFRPDTYEPSILLMWADFAYFWHFSPCPCLAAGAGVSRSAYLLPAGREPFPRWVAYVNLWAALLYAPGQMIIFFKDGPFSWHGIVGMYLPYIAYFAWIATMSWSLIKIAHDENS